jgi:hypothetical protein
MREATERFNKKICYCYNVIKPALKHGKTCLLLLKLSGVYSNM